ncbi:Hsp20/alpha crystallin family protein [Zhengella sp. ZM62]|uniref:Hsp20/alpha crystallin family protein n=1 Tax=Zhengella sedimenti TaxID=3390035 RepID=UPI003976CDEF
MSDKNTRQDLSLWSGNPFADFRKQMDDLMEGFFGSGGTLAARSGLPSLDMTGAVRPAIDIAENDEAITLTAELPGMSEDQVDLTIRNGMLTLKGEKKIEHDGDRDDVHVIERSYGAFQRSFPIPERVDAEAIEASFDKGVLTVTMPKRKTASAGGRKVEIGKG